jgi:hypothetical protein
MIWYEPNIEICSDIQKFLEDGYTRYTKTHQQTDIQTAR